jgi:hypothetical protein
VDLLDRLKVEGPLDGATLGHMVRLLAANDVGDALADGLPRGRLRRLVKLLLIGARNSCLSLVADLRYGAAVRAAWAEAPVFILGYWRSGTTHLHNLLNLDSRLVCPNHYEVFHPRTFLLTEDAFRKSKESAGLFRRKQDNVLSGPLTPAEDSFAIAALTTHASYIPSIFPSSADRYSRYLCFDGVPEKHIGQWRDALGSFLSRLTVRYPGRTLVLKSPDHTAHIKQLLGMFPDARFVHIHRNPFEIFQSSIHLALSVGLISPAEREARLETALVRYIEVQDAFLRERALIPPGNFYEIGYSELTSDPIGRMRAIYEALRLPDFAGAEPAIRHYLDALSGYERNNHAPLDPSVVDRIIKAWRPYFEAWGYPLTPAQASVPA